MSGSPVVTAEEKMLALLTKNNTKCADYYTKCKCPFDRMELWKHLGDKQVMTLQQAYQAAEQERDRLRRDIIEERQGAAAYLEGAMAGHNQTIARLQAENKVLREQLKKAMD